MIYRKLKKKIKEGWDLLIMIEDELLKNRIIFLKGTVDRDSAYDIITKLLYLDSQNNEEINLYIDSPGGSVISGLAIIDCMDIIHSPVATFCIGSAYSMGAIILASGFKGKRYCLPNSEVMIHAPSGAMEGKADEVMLSSKRLENSKKKLIEILAKNTKKTKKQIDNYFRYDNFMNSKEALEFGIVDKIL